MGEKINPDSLALNTSANVTRKRKGKDIDDEDYDYDEGEECDDETLKKHPIYQVQAILDENNVLIEEVNRNHASKIADKMVKNVGLISKINSNLLKVQSLYSDISVDFLNKVRKRLASDGNGENMSKSVDDSVRRC